MNPNMERLKMTILDKHARTAERALEVAACVAAGMYIALVMGVVWLTTAVLLAHYDPAAAQGAQTKTQHVKPKQEKLWKVYAEHDAHKHVACVAERTLDNKVTVNIRANTNKRYLLTLSGVNFGLDKAQLSFSLLQFDDEDPFELYAKAVSQRITAIEPSLVKEEVSRFLQQLSRARILKIVVNDKYYELDLKDTGNVMTELATCNAEGQNKLNRKRVKTAQAAEITNG